MESKDEPIPREVLAALSQLPHITKQVRDIAVQIKKDAALLAPKNTGRLSRGIAVERVYDEVERTVSYIVGWDDKKAFYGLLVEQGTVEHVGRPHLVPAAIKNGAIAPRIGSGA